MSKKKKPVPASASAPGSPPAAAPAATTTVEADSPRRRLIANVTLTVFGLYVAMIYLLALDQQFHWGIFGP